MIKLIVGNIESFNGYKKIGITRNLEEIDDGECTEIRGVDICNYLHITEIKKYVSELCKKLSHGGTISIGGYDIWLIQNSRNSITTEDLNGIMFPDPSLQIKGAYHLRYVVDLLCENGIKITNKYCDETNFVVCGVRP
jgi:hypothetical protein